MQSYLADCRTPTCGCALHSRRTGSAASGTRNTDGIYGKISQTFVEIQGSNVILSGSIDFGTGSGQDAKTNSYSKAKGVVNWANTFSNGVKHELLKGSTVGKNGIYIVGDS